MNKPAVSRINTCHVITEETPRSGSWNMSVDEALLESASKEGKCWLRWYQWSEPTVSLGYFQSGDIPRELAGLPTVRRLSGGGAILHHHELTYAAAIPADHAFAKTPTDLYREIHGRIISVLTDYGIPAERRGTSADSSDEPFLCFLRKDANDVVVRTDKILGSAQRRRRGAVLQHGSLLLKKSNYAKGVPGLFDLGLDSAQLPNLRESMHQRVSACLGLPKSVECLSEFLMHVAVQLEQIRYKAERKVSG